MIGALALVVAAVLVSPVAAPAPRQTTGASAGDSGVTVVVDFQELGGGVQVLSALGPVSSGLEALERAGVSYQTTQRFPGFVCRIADEPGDDRCVNASPASAYWGYWIAAPGGAWCYSTLGAGNRKPPPGTFEGWSFSLDKVAAAIPPPRFTPPAATSTPLPTLNTSDCKSTPQAPAPTTTVTTAATTTAATTTAATTTPPATAPTTTPPATTAASSATITSTSTAVATTDTAPPTTAVDLGEDGGDGGSPVGFVVSAAVVAAVAAGGVMVVRRRRLRGPR